MLRFAKPVGSKTKENWIVFKLATAGIAFATQYAADKAWIALFLGMIVVRGPSLFTWIRRPANTTAAALGS